MADKELQSYTWMAQVLFAANNLHTYYESLPVAMIYIFVQLCMASFFVHKWTTSLSPYTVITAGNLPAVRAVQWTESGFCKMTGIPTGHMSL